MVDDEGVDPGVDPGDDDADRAAGRDRSAPADQPVETVDATGRVVGLVTRAEMRARNLPHRAVSVVVRRPADGAVLVHRRAGWKDLWPGRWDLAFGGVADPGESDDDAARRELAEEAGLVAGPGGGDPALRRIGPARYDGEVRWVGSLYEVRAAGPFRFDDGEVVEVAWVPVAELADWTARHEVCPDNVEVVGAWLLGAAR